MYIQHITKRLKIRGQAIFLWYVYTWYTQISIEGQGTPDGEHPTRFEIHSLYPSLGVYKHLEKGVTFYNENIPLEILHV